MAWNGIVFRPRTVMFGPWDGACQRFWDRRRLSLASRPVVVMVLLGPLVRTSSGSWGSVRAADEALGTGAIGCGEHFQSGLDDLVGEAVVDGPGRQQPDPPVAVSVVVPARELATDAYG
jgi:hypothetical protein